MKDRSGKVRLAMLAAVLGNCIWGFSFLFTKLGLRDAEPTALLFWRFLFAVIALNIVALRQKASLRLKGKPWPKLMLMGLCEPVLYFLFESHGILNSTATFSGVMIALIPIMALLMAALFMKEIPTLRQVLFSVLSVAGVVVLSLEQTGSGGSTSILGVLLLLGAVISGAAYTMLSRLSSREFSAFSRTYWMFTEGFVFFTLLALIQYRGNFAALLEPMRHWNFVLSALFLGLASSVTGYFLINYSATYLPVAQMTAFVNITTLVSIFAGVVLLREKATAVLPLASAAILVGVWGVQTYTRERMERGKKNDV